MTSSNESGIRVAVVPARGGSKRIPRKNLVDFHGKPIIHWPLEMLADSGFFDVITVSTDDEQISEVASMVCDAEIVERPVDLAGDEVATAPVIVHAIRRLEERHGVDVTQVTVVYPAAVFTVADDLVSADGILHASSAEMVMSVGKHQAPTQRSWRRVDGSVIERVSPEFAMTRSQDLEEHYFDAGQFYVSLRSVWERLAAGCEVRTAMYEMEPWRVCDIDTPDDLEMAKRLFQIDRLL